MKIIVAQRRTLAGDTFLIILAVLMTLMGCGQSGSPTQVSPSATQLQAARLPLLTWHSAVNPLPEQVPAGQQTGIISILVRDETVPIKAQSLPANTSSLLLALSGTQLESPYSFSISADQIVDGQASLSISNLQPGTYTLDVVAKDATGNILAAQRATISIVAGSVCRHRWYITL